MFSSERRRFEGDVLVVPSEVWRAWPRRQGIPPCPVGEIGEPEPLPIAAPRGGVAMMSGEMGASSGVAGAEGDAGLFSSG